MARNDKNLQGIYNTLKKEGYNPPAYEDFVKDMQNDQNLQGVHFTLKKHGYTPPEFDTFKTDMFGSSDSATTAQPSATAVRASKGTPAQTDVNALPKTVAAPSAQPASKGWQPTTAQRIRASHNIQSMMEDVRTGNKQREEALHRSSKTVTPEGREDLRHRKWKAEMLGVDTRTPLGVAPTDAERLGPADENGIHGVSPIVTKQEVAKGPAKPAFGSGMPALGKDYKEEIAKLSPGAREKLMETRKAPSGDFTASPIVYDVRQNEDASYSPVWMTADGQLTDRRFEANKAEGRASEARKERAQQITLAQQIQDAEALQEELEEALNARREKLDSVNNEFSEKHPVLDFMKQAAQTHNVAASMNNAVSSDDKYRTDDEYVALQAALARNKESLQRLYDARDGNTNEFWHSMGTAFGTGKFSMGERSRDASRARAWAKRNKDSNVAQLFMNADAKNEETAAQYGNQYGMFSRVGSMFVESLDFMKDIVLLGGGPLSIAKGTSRAITNAGIKAIGKYAEKKAPQLFVKATGMFGGSMAGGAMIANTTGATKTIANVLDQTTGRAYKNEKGEYDISDGESLGKAILNAERELSVENATELVGGLLPGGVVVKALDKLGLSKVSNFVRRTTGKKWYQSYNNVLQKAGFNGTPAEAMEEYAGMVYNTILGDGANQLEAFKDKNTHIDIWLGCLTMGALLNAPNVIGSAYSSAQYHRYKHGVGRADKKASAAFGEQWDKLRESIDATPNENMPVALVNLLSGNDFNEQEQKALLDYAGALQQFRGYNMGAINVAASESETPSEESKTLNNSYNDGYDSSDALSDIQEEYKTQKQRLVTELGSMGEVDMENILRDIDSDPEGALGKVHDPALKDVVNDYVNSLFRLRGAEQRGKDALDDEYDAGAAVYNDVAKHRSPEATDRMSAIVERMQEAYQAVEDAFGSEAEYYMYNITEDPWSVISNPTLTYDQREAALEFVNAKAAMDGVNDASNEAAEARRKTVEAQIDRRTHREAGMIQTATMKVNDRQVYIVKGDVVMFADGSGIDSRNSSGDIIVMDAETGEYEFTSPDQLMNIGEVIDPQEELQRAYDEIEAERQAIINPAQPAADTAQPDGMPESQERADGEISGTAMNSDGNSLNLSENKSINGNRSEQNNDTASGAEGKDTVRPMAADAAGSVAGNRDRSSIRSYEEGLANRHYDGTEYSERNRREAESERLVGIAKTDGQYFDRNRKSSLGIKHPKGTGESEVYRNVESNKIYKVKNPYAKSPMKGNVQPEDAIYEHLVHNKYFPETAYGFEGISDDMGDARIVLSQDYIESVGQPSAEQIEAALAEKGLVREGKYSFGNDEITVTDVTGDNALLGADGKVYFIDPIINFKKPVREILGEPDQEKTATITPSSATEVEEAPLQSALSRIPVNEQEEPMFEAAPDSGTAWDGLVEYLENVDDAADYARQRVESLAKEVEKGEKNISKAGAGGSVSAFRQARREAREALEMKRQELEAWKGIVNAKWEREREEAARKSAEEQARRDEQSRRFLEQQRKAQEEAAAAEAAARAERERQEQARLAAEEEAERQRMLPDNQEKTAARNNFEEYMAAERSSIMAQGQSEARQSLNDRIQQAQGGKQYGRIYEALSAETGAPTSLEEYLARVLSIGETKVLWNGHGNLNGEIFGKKASEKVSERKLYSWMTSEKEGVPFAKLVHSLWEGVIGDESLPFNTRDLTDQDVRNGVIDLLRSYPTSRALFEHAIELHDARSASDNAQGQLAELDYYADDIRDDWYQKHYGMGYEEYNQRVETIYNELERSGITEEDISAINDMIADEEAERINNRQENESDNERTLRGVTADLQAEQSDQRAGDPSADVAGSEAIGRGSDSAGRGVSAEERIEPTEAQKAAGNYKMEHRRVDGHNISIENPKGSVRRGTGADGKPWETVMQNDYGYIRGTEGVDGDHIDVFLSNTPEEGDVFVVDQVNEDGSFDEHKVMYGFPNEQAARDAYLSNYEPGWTGLGAITHVSKDEFKKWIGSSKRKTKPFADYKSVQVYKEQNPVLSVEPDVFSDFGPVFTQFKGNAQGAIKLLSELQDGEAIGALHHKDIGDIDLVWGKAGTAKSDGYGLAKLVKYHPEVVEHLQEILDDMHIVKRSENRINLESDTHKAAVRLTWNKEKKKWLLTAFEKKETSESIDKTTDTDDNPTDLRGDTALSQNSDVSDGKDNTFSANNQINKKQSGVADKLADKQPQSTESSAFQNRLADFAGRYKSAGPKDIPAIERDLAKWMSSLTAEDLVGLDAAMLVKICNEVGLDKGKAYAFRMSIDKATPKELLPEVFELRSRIKKQKSEAENGTSGTIMTTAKAAGPETKTETNKADKSDGSGRPAIEDFGEKIAGARKDMLHEVAKSIENVTVQSLIELPMSKAFKRPNLKKMVDSGAISDQDATLAEAIMQGLIYAKKKPALTRRLSSKRDISAWANETYNGIKMLGEILSGDRGRREAAIAKHQEVMAENLKKANEHIARLREWNPSQSFDDLTSTPDPLDVMVKILDGINYRPGEKVSLPLTRVEISHSGQNYEVSSPGKQGALWFKRFHKTEDEAINTAILAAKLARGDNDVEIPERHLRIKGVGTRQIEPTGKYEVLYWGPRDKLLEKIFDNESEAKAFAEKNNGRVSEQKRYTNDYEGYTAVVTNPLTGNSHAIGEVFADRGDLLSWMADNREDVNTLAVEAINRETGTKNAPRAHFYVSTTWERGERRPRYSVVEDDKNNPWPIVKDFTNRGEAEAWLKENMERLESERKARKEKERAVVYFDNTNGERRGKDHRQGKDATPEMFNEAFGFRGVQFGNWTNNNDRQAALNQAYDAFMDMAEELGLSPRAMSLDGELGLAFGARGSGNALAHYEPTEVVINLTKTRGAGALAHEWLHALDNFMSRRNGVPLGHISHGNGTEKLEPTVGNALKSLMGALDKSDYTKRSREKGEYWGRNTEIMARLFESWIADRIKRKGDRSPFLAVGLSPKGAQTYQLLNYLAYKADETRKAEYLGEEPQIMSQEEFNKLPESLRGYPYPTQAELESFTPYIDNLFKALGERETETGSIANDRGRRYGKQKLMTGRSLFDWSGEENLMIGQQSERNEDVAASEQANNALDDYASSYDEYLKQTQAIEERTDLTEEERNELIDASGELLLESREALKDQLRQYYIRNNTPNDAERIVEDMISRAQAEVEIQHNKRQLLRDIIDDPQPSITVEENTSKDIPVKTGGGTLRYNAIGHLPDAKAGEFSYIERQFSRSGEFDFTGNEHLRDRGDVAYLFRALEDYSIEHVFAAFVKEGKVKVMHIGMGGPTASYADLGAIRAGYDAFGAEQIFLVHNHPSGNLTPSRADQSLMRRLEEAFGDGVEVDGLIMDTTSGRYTTFDSSGESEQHSRSTRGDDLPVDVYRFDKAPRTAKNESPVIIKSSEDVVGFIKSQRFDDKKKISYLVLSNSNEIVGNFHTDYTDISEKGLAEEIASVATKYGGTRVIVYGNADIKRASTLKTGISRHSLDGVTLLDAVESTGSHNLSANDEGYMREESGVYGSEAERGMTNSEGRFIARRTAEDVEGLDKLDEVAQKRVGQFLSKYNSAPIRVVADIEDIKALSYPEDVTEEMINRLNDGGIPAVFNHYDKKVYIFAPRFNGYDKKITVLIHENIHGAIDEYGDYPAGILDSFQDKILASGYESDRFGILEEGLQECYSEESRSEEFMAYTLPWMIKKPEREKKILSLMDEREREFINKQILNKIRDARGRKERERNERGIEMANLLHKPGHSDNDSHGGRISGETILGDERRRGEGVDGITSISGRIPGRGGIESRQPNGGDNIRFRSSVEIDKMYPNWLDGTTTESGKHSTQVEGTRKTYGKVGDWIETHLGKEVSILDASSGMGYGTRDLRERGFDIEDVEPYQSAKRKLENPATYDSYNKIDKQYDYIISNAVLNVIPDDWRSNVLHDMAARLRPGGKMFINTRKAGEEKTIKDKIELDTSREVLVKRNGKIASYQRFFTPVELKEWVASELGDGYNIEIANESNSGTKGLAAIVVTRNREVIKSDSRDPKDMESRVNEMSARLHTPVRIVKDETEISQLPSARHRSAKGWWSNKDGVVIVLANNKDVADVENSFLHETMGHDGLRLLFPTQELLDNALDELYSVSNKEIKANIDARVQKMMDAEVARLMREKQAAHGDPSKANADYYTDLASAHAEANSKRKAMRREATEEYGAEVAGKVGEKGFERMTAEELTFWGKIKEMLEKAFANLLRGLKIPKMRKWSDKQWAYIYHKAYKMKKAGGRLDVFAEAEDIAMRRRTGYDEAPLRPLTKAEKENLRKEATAGRIEELFDRSVRGDLSGKPVTVGKLTPEGKSYLEKLSGMKMKENVSFVINPSAMVHIYREHFDKNEKDKGNNIPLSKGDIRELSNIISNPERVVFGVEPDGLKRKMFYFLSQADEGAYNLLEIYGDRKGNLTAKTFYKTRKAVSQRVLSLMKSEHLTSVTDGASLSDGAKLPKFFEYPTTEGEESLRFRDSDPGLEEYITRMKAEAMQANTDNLQAKRDAMRAIGGNLSHLRQAMARQRDYDITTAKSVTDLARILMDANLLDDLSKFEIKRILGAVNNVIGKEDVSKHVQKVMDIMVDNQLRMGANALGKLLSIRGSKIDARGIQVQGVLDPEGQAIAQVVRKSTSLPKDDIDNRIAEAINRMSSTDQAIADEAAIEYAGLQMARQYVEDITESKAEEKALRDSIREAKEAKDAGQMTEDAYRQYVESTEDAIRQNKIERAEAYNSLVEQVGGVLSESVDRAKAWREAEKQRVEEIHHNANSDMEGRPTDEHHKDDRMQKMANNSFARFLLSPLATFDQMLRMFGKKNSRGEGYLWNRYMRDWVTATEKEYTGYRDALKVLDAKVSEIYGKDMTWGDLFTIDRKLPKSSVRFFDGGEMKDHMLTQGNLLYIYMADKMSDGRMKLRRMGITEEDIENIKNFLDPRFIELADWMQEEFLVDKRNEYNEVHKRMFGASMAAIENYFPLKILANARLEDVDVADDTTDTALPATSTGSIIKRRRNNLALDVTGANAFSVILDHLQQMERWAAFAEFNRDLNTLLSYKRFRNQVMNMSSAYGAGKTLWNNFRNVCSMAAGAYRPPIADLDKSAVNIAKGVTAAKVNFRVFTALKQFLSMPAYVSDSTPLYLAANIANPIGAWRWSMENLPLFEKRWRSRMAGDPRLMKTDMDWKMWRNRAVEIASRIGMSPNAFVDALTVSIGAHSMYQTKLAKYKRQGYDPDVAEERAKQDATILFNQTQQSSEGAFLSTMQVDRSWLSVLFTVFRNSSMSYTRQLYDSIRNIGRRLTPGYKAMSEEFMAKQMRRDGIDPDKADRNAKQEYRRGIIRDLVRVGIFGYVLQLAWNLGAYLPYLIFGDDDDEKDKMWQDAWRHAMFGSIEGLTGGDVMSAAGNMLVSGDGNLQNLAKDMPMVSDVLSILKKVNKDRVSAMNDVINLLVQSGLGVNPQSLTDAVVAVIDICGDDAQTSRECALLIARVLNCPQSQLDKIYFDELDATGEEASRMTPAEIAERYAEYKTLREAPLTGWLRNEDEADSAMEKHRKKALNIAKEKIDKRMTTAETQRYLSEYDRIHDLQKGVNALRETDRDEFYNRRSELWDQNNMLLYRRIGFYKRDIKQLTKELLRTQDPQERDSITRQMLKTRDVMLEDAEALEAEFKQ